MPVTITFDLPPDVESRLRQDSDDLGAAAKHAYLVELYRKGKLSHVELSRALGLDRFATDGVLKQHGIMAELDAEQFARELTSLRELVRK